MLNLGILSSHPEYRQILDQSYILHGDVIITKGGIKVSNSAILHSTVKSSNLRISRFLNSIVHHPSKMQGIAKITMMVSIVLSVIFALSDTQMIDPCKQLRITVRLSLYTYYGLLLSVILYSINFQFMQYSMQ